MNIFLHRDDLRIKDNHGLYKASADSKTIPVYVKDSRVTERTGNNKLAFRNQGLSKLAAKYDEEGSGLILREGKTAEVLRQLVQQFDADKVYYNRSYTPIKRSIGGEIEDLDLETKSFKDRLMVEPRQLGREYTTFSPFYRTWKEKPKLEPYPRPENLAKVESSKIGSSEELKADIPEAGEEAARRRWRKFRENRLRNYKHERDNLSEPGSVSRLSMYYSSGMISPREPISEIESMIEEETDSGTIRNYAKYRNELAWREFFYQVLWYNAESTHENYRDFENPINWKDNPEELKAWKKGETGVPFVDAGIRELKQTGYMHNRLRQNVASFLTKHLMVDWRKGAKFFRRHLVDHDTASNIGGWQWAASTGTDSVSIRIFNPVKQGRKYDSEAEYIKRWIPELRGLEPEEIHGWVEMGEQERNSTGADYPEPIVNFNKRYHKGKNMFEEALGN